MMIDIRTIVPFLLLVAATASQFAVGQQNIAASDLHDVVYQDANAIAIFDFDALKSSQWAAKNDVKVGEFISMPSDTRMAAVVAEVDFDYWVSKSHLAVVSLNTSQKIKNLRSGKRLISDTIDGQKVVWTGEQTSVMDFGDDAMIILPERSRQSVGRFIRTLDEQKQTSAKSKTSPFLRRAIDRAKGRRSFFHLAMELQDTISPTAIERYLLSEAEAIPDAKQIEVRNLLSGLEGFVVSVSASDDLRATIDLEFTSDATVLEGIAAGLVDNWLEQLGANIENVADWETTTRGNQVTMHGPITTDTLRDVASLAIQSAAIPNASRIISRELRLLVSGKDHEVNGIGSQVATVNFMQSMKRLLESLQIKTGANPSRSRFWIDRCALRIQYLDRELVDDNALRFADRTTSQLRLMSEVLENAEIAAEQSEDMWPSGGRLSRPVAYGGVVVQRRPFFFNSGSIVASYAISDDLADERREAGALKVREIGVEVIRDFNATGKSIAQRYEVPFENWVPATR